MSAVYLLIIYSILNDYLNQLNFFSFLFIHRAATIAYELRFGTSD
jgi:hypothetical protein